MQIQQNKSCRQHSEFLKKQSTMSLVTALFFFGLPNLFTAYVVQPSENTGKLVSEWNENMLVNPEEMGEYFQGDIIVDNSKNGLVDLKLRWENGVVPYVITGPYSKKDLETIYGAMEEYHNKTCIRFRRKTSKDSDYLNIQNSMTGCWSSVGRKGGKQDLNLQSPGCVSTFGTPIHELMHALGFHHEQTRFERDDFVTINWENIVKGRENNFEKLEEDTSTAYGVEYDYDSVMHYSMYAFSKNQKPTIDPKESEAKIGQRYGFSTGDLHKVNAMYNCSNVDLSILTTETPDYNVPSSNIFTEIVNTIFG